MNFNRKYKNRIRENGLINPMEKIKSLESILCLPFSQCLDLKGMLVKGIINRKTYVIAVERNPVIARQIEKFLKANFDCYYLHIDEFYNLDLQDALDNEKLDFAYLDFCGNFNYEIKSWLYKNNQFFKDDSRVCFTFKVINRHKKCENATKKYAKFIRNEIEEKMEFAISNFSKGFWGKNIQKDRFNVISSVNYYVADLFTCFDTKDFDVNQMIMYKDGNHSEMVFIDIQLNGIKKTTKAFFEQALYHYFNHVCQSKANIIRKILGIKTVYKSTKRKKRGTVIPKKTIIEMCGIKNRKDSLTRGRKMVISKYIMKYSTEHNITTVEARKRVWGGINKGLTSMENKRA